MSLIRRSGIGRATALAPRLTIVVLGAMIFAETLTLRVFGPEVNAKLTRARDKMVAQERSDIDAHHAQTSDALRLHTSAEIAKHEKVLADLQDKIAQADERRRHAGQDAVQAVRSRHVHYLKDGSYYLDTSVSRAVQAEEQRLAREGEKLREELRPDLGRHGSEIERLRAEQLSGQERLDAERQAAIDALAQTPTASGLIARLVAFEEICAANPSARWARILFALLLMGVELAPTFAKFGDRSEAALIRERMYGLLRSSLRSERLGERLGLWLESSAHVYVDGYMKDLDAAMGVPGAAPLPAPPPPRPRPRRRGRRLVLFRDRSSTEAAAQNERVQRDEADERVHQLILIRSQAHQDKSGTTAREETNGVQ